MKQIRGWRCMKLCSYLSVHWSLIQNSTNCYCVENQCEPGGSLIQWLQMC